MPANGTNTRTLTGPPAAVSRMQVTAPATRDSSTINYTGAAASPPTGWTQHNSNQARTAANTPTDAIGPTAAASGKAGFILCSDNGQPLPLSTIAAGNWQFRFNHSSTGTLGPTIAVAVRAFQVSVDLATMTPITLPGATSSGWVLSATFTAAQTGTLITVNSVGAVTLAAGTPYLYIEWAIRVTTGGSNLSANAQALSNTEVNALPAVTLARGVSEAVTAAADSVARAQVLVRPVAETLTAASDSAARTFAAVRDVGETVTAVSDAIARIFLGERAVSETTTASDSVARVILASRSVSETVPAADDMATRELVQSRAVTETVPLVADLVARMFAGERALTEAPPAASDVVDRAVVAARVVGESLPAPTDDAARTVNAVRDISEAVPASTDAVARLFDSIREISEPVPSSTDSVVREVATGRDVAETTPATADSVARVFIANRFITEQLAGEGGGGGPVTEAEIAAIANAAANAVWDELVAEVRASGSYGEMVGARVDVAVSTRASGASVTALGSPAQADEVGALLARLTAARATALDLIDATVSSRAQAADLTTLLGRLTAARADALDLIDVASSTRASESSLAAVGLLVDDLESRLTAARALLLDNLDAKVSTRATPADVSGGGGGGASVPVGAVS